MTTGPITAAEEVRSFEPRAIEVLQLIGRIASLMTIALGALCLGGWAYDLPTLKSIHPSFVTMKANTALAFLLGGFATWFLRNKEVRLSASVRQVALACAAAVTLIGASTLYEYLFDVSLGIDELLFHESPDAVATSTPGRMAPNTALDFVLIGLALLLMELLPMRRRRPSQWLLVLAGSIAFLAMLGYLYDASDLYGLGYFTSMAVHTSLGFILLCAAAYSVHRQGTSTTILTSATAGGQIARRLLPIVVGLPVLVGWLWLMGQRAGYYDSTMGLSLMVAVCAAILSIMVWWNARVLDNADLERRRDAKAMQQLNAQLQASNKELEAFSYSVSHDLRTPLRGIDGFSQIILEDNLDKLDEQSAHALQRIRAASQRMARLIDDLLALSRITRTEMARERVDLGTIGRAVEHELRESQPDRDVDVRIAEGLVTEGDPRLLHIFLQQLIGNAWKFTSKRAQAIIEVGVTEEDGTRVFFVRDNGAGFDPKYTHKLFDAFERLHTATEFEGTGIGLATVQRIIERHGGRIWAEARVDEGATFHFTLARPGASVEHG